MGGRADSEGTGENLSDLVLRDGDHVRASGRVVSHDGGVWLEAPVPVRAARYLPSAEPPRFGGFGVAVRGVDLTGLTYPRRGEHVVEGWASISGTWRAEILEASDQAPPQDEHRPVRQLGTPPCQPPPAGWPRSAHQSNLEPWPEWVGRRPDVVTIAAFRPSPTQVVLVVAATDPEAVERDVRPVYGDRLCVVASRWSRSQVDSAVNRLGRADPMSGIYESGESVTESGQAVVEASTVRVVPALVDRVAGLPTGLVSVHAWLVPARTWRGAP